MYFLTRRRIERCIGVAILALGVSVSPAETPKGDLWTPVASVGVEQPPASQIGDTHIVDSPLGRYREGGKRLGDRFAYTVHLSGAPRLVRLTVAYPDDRIRAAGISVLGPPQEALGSGYSCGDEFPLTNRMLTRQMYFYSRSQDVAIIISTEAAGQPAAVASLGVEEAPVCSLPPAPKPVLGARHHRLIGLYWEDAILTRCFAIPDSTQAEDFDQALDRCLNYCKFCGLDYISYPVYWYYYPLYKSSVDKGYPLQNRLHPPDFMTRLAKRCSEDQIAFAPSINAAKLSAVRPFVRTEAEVIAGVESANVVERTGRIVTWKNAKTLSDSVANIFYPPVQKAVEDLVREIAEQCADEASFTRLDLLLWPSSLLKPGGVSGTDSEGSYDDYSVGKFAASIGQTPPGVVGDAGRFVERYHWIHDDPDRLQAWLKWRAEQMTQLYQKLGQIVHQARAEARLGIGIYSPSPHAIFEKVDPGEEIYGDGIDLAALAKDRNLQFVRFLHPMVSRWWLRFGMPRPHDLNLENEPSFQKAFAAVGPVGALLHQQYFETPVTVPGGLLQLPAPFEKESAALAPNTGLRVCEPLPSGRNYLRPFAGAVQNFDANSIAVGGYVLGTQGVEGELREFARAFTALPAVAFENVKDADGVIVRRTHAEGSAWTYAVNVTGAPRTVLLSISGSGALRNAATGEEISVQLKRAKIELEPYGLMALRSQADTEVVGAELEK
ncbi:MAG TPA: hypothetical protein VG722_02600 [Tepidisphaeraceae bacterium]|nr:hypothetical protein [Tepidisphaeraceae bacterium]